MHSINYLRPLRVWLKALPASDLQVLLDDLLLSTFDALEAILFEVCFLFAMTYPFIKNQLFSFNV
ncbi:hypothetical protein LCX93_11575 [Sulfurimonas sp. SWIR-19]|uniref:hypothetical protein n=1 Tax=Sulfurimonas sp. SWIR-19 TaxID=2878390 RepID=UPI001CF354A3|nr:hypothetical protein [Sulfurimonas sp. SWIR-19]UCN00150.1 hypothetical protein LCX93_11575 [Sulfurimonas sp. SWIR-19]